MLTWSEIMKIANKHSNPLMSEKSEVNTNINGQSPNDNNINQASNKTQPDTEK